MDKAAKALISASAVLLALQAQAWAQKPDVGKAEYLSSCAVCHGTDAKGKGSLAGQLKAAPADLTQLAKKNGGVFPLNAVYEKIDGRQDVKAHGPRDMPIWGVINTRLFQWRPIRHPTLNRLSRISLTIRSR
jgi:mono/diheme cytochrome c family protein